MPFLPLKDSVVFPGMIVPLMVGRPLSVAAVDECISTNQFLFVCAQKDVSTEIPHKHDLYRVGVVARVHQALRTPDGNIKVILEGLARASVRRIFQQNDLLNAMLSPITSKPVKGKQAVVLMRTALSQFEQYSRLGQRIAPEVVSSFQNLSDPEVLADLIAAYMSVRVEERQELLETENVADRLEKIAGFLMRENELLQMEQRVRDRVREQMEQSQREYFLHEQLKVIHQELGKGEEGADEYTELRQQIQKAKMPKEVEEKALRELGRYQRTPYLSPEGTVIRTYIEWLCDMPWHKRSKDSIDLAAAQKALDEDHYGLEKVKERILEFLAVRKLSKQAKGPILCLVGPPGVGKTSLGKSIARAMGRKFVRVSLGGVRDEAEIRGHRRTYVGSLPGRIIQSMKKAGVRNPVFMLDEIDKLNADFRGDPASALLEVLDPEQNHAFNDHYLEVDFDLRDVFFITTANNEFEIPHALHDRMEIVRLPGYTIYEKEHIAHLFLIPKQRTECGIKNEDLEITPDALGLIINRYTREAGVRELERRIAGILRKTARRLVSETPEKPIVIDAAALSSVLGPYEYTEQRIDAEPIPGVAIGMAWTMSGGDILHIETSTMKGRGAVTLTGQLGDVMQESAKAAYSYLRAHAEELGISTTFHRTTDMHVHVPEGAISKDGPSAGVSIAVSMLSALRNAAPKASVALTGEITLRGRVLPVGGIKEKVLAAHRAGIRTVIIPQENEKDLVEIPAEVKSDITFHLVERVDDVFALAL